MRQVIPLDVETSNEQDKLGFFRNIILDSLFAPLVI
jgi:hypothetical protein